MADERKRQREDDDVHIIQQTKEDIVALKSEDEFIRGKLFFHIGWAEMQNIYLLDFIHTLQSQVKDLQNSVEKFNSEFENLKKENEYLREDNKLLSDHCDFDETRCAIRKCKNTCRFLNDSPIGHDKFERCPECGNYVCRNHMMKCEFTYGEGFDSCTKHCTNCNALKQNGDEIFYCVCCESTFHKECHGITFCEKCNKNVCQYSHSKECSGYTL